MMSVEQAQKLVFDKVKDEVVSRYGESFYEDVLTGHLITESVNWFAPYLFGKASDAGTTVPSPLFELSEVCRFFARELRRPALEVQCNLGCIGASLKVDLAIDRDPNKIDLARVSLPGLEFQCKAIEDVEGEATYATVLTAFGLGRMDAGRGQPIFLDFVTHATRLLAPGGRILVAERARFQDNIVEPLVALDYEIAKLSSIKGTGSVMIVAMKP